MGNENNVDIDLDILNHKDAIIKAQNQTLEYGLKLLSIESRSEKEELELQKCIGHFESVLSSNLFDALGVDSAEYISFLQLATEQ